MKNTKDINRIMKIDSVKRLGAIAEACRRIIESFGDTCQDSRDFYAGMLEAAETRIRNINAAANL